MGNKYLEKRGWGGRIKTLGSGIFREMEPDKDNESWKGSSQLMAY